MMIHDKPIVAVLHVNEAVAGGQALRPDVAKGVVAGIDGHAAIYTDQLLAIGNL
jgi:hypothetical protein